MPGGRPSCWPALVAVIWVGLCQVGHPAMSLIEEVETVDFAGEQKIWSTSSSSEGKEENSKGLPVSPRTAEEWFGGLGEFEVVVPMRVDAQGQPVHDADHYFHTRDARKRRRRSVHEEEELTDGQKQNSDNLTFPSQVFYQIHAFGRAFHLELKPDEGFVSPNLVVEHMDVGESWLEREEDLPVGAGCFHRGAVRGDSNSDVVVSICDSMLGVFKAHGEQYYIEPHPNHTDIMGTSSKLHVVYKHQRKPKTSSSPSSSSCGVKGNYKHERWKEQPDPGSGSARNSYSNKDNYASEFISNVTSRHRHKRSISYERFVEVMVVADRKMADFHGKKLNHYILALMSIVQAIYRDPSIGNSINIIVVRIIVLHSDEAGPKISQNAAATLQHFCRWQHRQNSEGDDPYHHDTSVLITRVDLCRSQLECDTMGLAELGTMCDSPRSCAINEDSGLSAAFTIAHELGHLFSMPHDDDSKCRSFMDKSVVYHVMAPTLDYQTDPWTWSECSTKMLTNFLEEGYGECLLDEPSREEKWEGRSPGEEFNAHKQCEFVFGPGYKICPYMAACGRLWCEADRNSKQGGCRTQHMPWADGSKCAPGKWCQHGKCVLQRRMQKLDGGWSRWQSYGSCSRTCGGGIKQAVRQCNNPRPRHGGAYCIGKRVKYRSCNTQDCPPSRTTFRGQQCSEFDGRHFNINGLPPSVQWIPKFAGIQMKDRCKLFCRVSTKSAYYLLKDKVLDGTKCGPDTSDVCVNGHCRPAGCDNILNSRAKRDQCGVCGGDNSSCKRITRHYNDSEVRYGYNHVVRIPKGATNIDIRQGHRSAPYNYNTVQDDNYLALRNSSDEFILNGNFVVTAFHKVIHLKGSKLEYSGSNNLVERINGSQMIHEDLQVLVLSVGNVQPPNIVYMYTISMSGRIPVEWSTRVGQWTMCSHICRGEKTQQVVCVRKEDRQIVSDQRCEAEKLPKPGPNKKPCNTNCDIRWYMVDQSECSADCGKGTVTRRYKCKIRTVHKSSFTADKHCTWKFGTPQLTGPCDGKCELTKWEYTPWTECSVSCGGGRQQRDAMCTDHKAKQHNRQHCDQNALVLSKSCNEDPCPEWQIENWTGCTVSCGRGFQYRQVWCKKGDKVVAEGFCNREVKPKTSKVCVNEPCPHWYEGLWGPCSVSCGTGLQRRDVSCQQLVSGQAYNISEAKCNAASRPSDIRPCHYPPCLLPTSTTTTTTAIPPPVFAAQTRTQWRTGSWTECSTTCGPGQRERYVSCRDYDGKIAEDEACSHSTKPASMEVCIRQHCGQWRTGEWTPCSESCGPGLERRYVTCMILDDLQEQRPAPAECDISVKPAEERACNKQLCVQPPNLDIISISSNRVVGTSHWRAGSWGGCSSTCEGGWQRRRVVCQDEKGASNDCDPQTMPSELQVCNSGPCPQWNYGDWGPCSRTCGDGTQERVTSCQLPNADTLPDSSCDILKRPVSARRCKLAACSGITRWHKSQWSPFAAARALAYATGAPQSVNWGGETCSVTCGRGQRTRQVICVDENRKPVPDHVCRQGRRKPKIRRRCRLGRCPQWIPLPWAGCSVSCGRGIQKREIRCAGDDMAALNATACVNQTVPDETRPCHESTCRQFHWKTKPWSPCSVTCGHGYRQRHAQCIDVTNGHRVASHHCLKSEHPKTKKRCSDNPCPIRWISSDWSPCSQSCGLGRQVSQVECRSVTREGWVTSRQVTGCDDKLKPQTDRFCNYGSCSSKYRWKPDRWGQCSAACGEGKARRDVLCVDERGNTHPRIRCKEKMPSRIKPCENRPCYAKSCGDLKALTTVRRDGEYSLMIEGKLISIYCSGMDNPRPMEYLSLASGYKNNYAHVFDKRLRRPRTCPYNTTLVGHCTSLCKKTPYRKAGYTAYSKIRLNITTLTTIGDDFKFSLNRGGRKINFASAGDCYSARSCPQGQFKVDLRGTGLHIAETTRWRSRGQKTTKRITISQDREMAEGICGGLCGYCLPVSKGLHLAVNP